MALTDQLGKPAENDIQQGRYTLTRAHLCEAAVAAPTIPVNLDGVQSVSWGPVEWGATRSVFQQGGGDEALETRRDPKVSGQITFLRGAGFDELAELLGITWVNSGGYASLPYFNESDMPVCTFECIARAADNVTHLFSQVFPDAILLGYAWDNPMDDSEWALPFYSRREPFPLCGGAYMVYDQFTGDGSTTDFTLSQTPIDLVDASNRRYWDYDNFVYIKEKASGDSTGTLQRTGYSNVTTTLTAATAPAAGTVIQVLYAAATA